MRMHKDWAKLHERSFAEWTIKPTKGGHFQWLSPGGTQIVLASGSPSNQGAIRDHESKLKRAEKREAELVKSNCARVILDTTQSYSI